MQFRQAQKEFLRFCRVEKRLSSHSLAAYELDILDFRRQLRPAKPIQQINVDDLKDYLDNMVTKRGLSPATVKRRLACLRSFFRRLSELGHAPDPFGTWRPKLPRRKRLPRALARSELTSLMGAIANASVTLQEREGHLRTAFRLIVATGMRVGELCALELSDVSPDGSVVRIHGKGSKDRVAYVTDPHLREGLVRLISWRRKMSPADAPMLINRCGARMRPQSLRSRLKRYASDAGVERGITPHMLRHTAATLLIETGVDIRFVQRLLGHSSIATTEIYTHVTDEALKSTLERANVLGTLQI